MLRSLRDIWKDWWPFISGAPVAIYTVLAYFSDPRNDLFLLARLFRWELLLIVVCLAVLLLMNLATPADSPWRPRRLIETARHGIRNLSDRSASAFQRIASIILLLSALFLTVALGQYVHQTYTFLRERYADVDRQRLIAQAASVELNQDLARAIALYQDILKDFPVHRFNYLLESKISQLKAREAAWRQAAEQVRRTDEKWPHANSVTRFDELAKACQYVSNTEPCTRIEDYHKEVNKVVTRASGDGANCRSVLADIPASSLWIFIDPVDAKWLGINPADHAGTCRSLGLRTGADVVSYLETRWLLAIAADLKHVPTLD